jgi:hypothetical protein
MNLGGGLGHTGPSAMQDKGCTKHRRTDVLLLLVDFNLWRVVMRIGDLFDARQSRASMVQGSSGTREVQLFTSGPQLGGYHGILVEGHQRRASQTHGAGCCVCGCELFTCRGSSAQVRVARGDRGSRADVSSYNNTATEPRALVGQPQSSTTLSGSDVPSPQSRTLAGCGLEREMFHNGAYVYVMTSERLVNV